MRIPPKLFCYTNREAYLNLIKNSKKITRSPRGEFIIHISDYSNLVFSFSPTFDKLTITRVHLMKAQRKAEVTSTDRDYNMKALGLLNIQYGTQALIFG